MACYSPIEAFCLTGERTTTGKKVIVFSEPIGSDYSIIQLPCGSCIGCRLERSRQWAVRCVHEASLHDSNCFLTLTYDPDKVPVDFDGSLRKRDLQLFWKRLRRRFHDVRFRYLCCGEYGSMYSRPHYHACVFGFDFPDKVIWKTTDCGNTYSSEILNDIWGYGYCIIGDVTFASAAYVAGYIYKKQLGKDGWKSYVDKLTGLIREPEFITMSRRPGIAKEWIKRYACEVYTTDSVVIDGQEYKPSRYYDTFFDSLDSESFLNIKEKRFDKGFKYAKDNTFKRLAVRLKIATAKMKLFKKRSYEND